MYRIKGWSSTSTDDNCFNVIAHWYGEKPKLPDSLNDIPAIWLHDSGGYVEQHRQVCQWIQERNEQRRQYRTMAQGLGGKLSDEQLRETPQMPASERNENGHITNMDPVFQFVPCDHDRTIDDQSAVDILRAAIDIVVYKRLSHIDS